MDQADTAQLAAILGALGAAAVLLGRTRWTVLAGFALLAAAEAGLGLYLTGGVPDGIRPTYVALGLAALVPLAGLTWLLVRRPALATPLVLAAAPFRLPLDFDPDHRFFVAVAEEGQLGRLLPLYAVLAAAGLALAVALVRGFEPKPLPPLLAWTAAAFLAYASVSLLWSSALHAGTTLLAYFLLPFAALVAIVARAPFPPWLPRALAGVAVALGCLFAAVGVWQAATERLLFFAPKLEVANEYGSFFRVTSLFRDPSLYGRHVVLAMAVLLVALWLRRVHVLVAAPLLALLWAGLYFSYSQSSMVALAVVAVGITLVAGDRVGRRLVLVLALVAAVGASGFLVRELADESARRVTSDRSRRVEVAAEVFREHPFAGAGIGSQPSESQARSERFGPPESFVSHTTPLTVAAELGALGLALYLALLAAAAVTVVELRRRDPALALALAAGLVALVVHSLFYSGFFEDPITWLLLALAASRLAVTAPEAARSPAPAARRELVPAS
jgi:O-Antigen ligase